MELVNKVVGLAAGFGSASVLLAEAGAVLVLVAVFSGKQLYSVHVVVTISVPTVEVITVDGLATEVVFQPE